MTTSAPALLSWTINRGANLFLDVLGVLHLEYLHGQIAQLRVRNGADHPFDSRISRQVDRKRGETQSQQNRCRRGIGGHFTTHRHGLTRRMQQSVHLMQASENGGMERIIEMHHGAVGTIHYKVV